MVCVCVCVCVWVGGGGRGSIELHTVTCKPQHCGICMPKVRYAPLTMMLIWTGMGMPGLMSFVFSLKSLQKAPMFTPLCK